MWQTVSATTLVTLSSSLAESSQDFWTTGNYDIYFSQDWISTFEASRISGPGGPGATNLYFQWIVVPSCNHVFFLVLKKAPNSVDQVKYEFKLQPDTANKELNLNLNILDINRQRKSYFWENNVTQKRTKQTKTNKQRGIHTCMPLHSRTVVFFTSGGSWRSVTMLGKKCALEYFLN